MTVLGDRAGAAVTSIGRRLRDRRRMARRRVRRLALAGLALLVTLGGGGWLAANSSWFAVRTVTVQGLSRLSVAQVLHAAHVRPGTSLFRLDPAAVGDRVSRLAPVADVQVSRDWPHGVVIHVTERRPVAAVQTSYGAVLLDATGVAFAHVPKEPRGLVPVEVGGGLPGAGEPDARAALRVLAELPKRLRGRITTIHAPYPDQVSVELRAGRTVVWGSPADGAAKARVLLALMHRPAHVYDVSTPAVAVTR